MPVSTSREAGPYNSRRTPYIAGIADAIEPDSNYQQICIKKSAQVGGSDLGLNVIGWAMSESQGPVLLAFPTGSAARAFSRKRISPMILLSKDLSEKINSRSERDKDNMLMEKRFRGGSSLSIVGCGSSAGLRTDAIKIAILEELSAFPDDVDGEGDPVELIWNRTKTFQDSRRFIAISTPANGRTCKITSMFEKSDKRYFHVPCPLCNMDQALVWEQIRYDPENPKASARYQCIACEELISHDYKTFMLDRGHWVITRPESRIAGFHISALYSPIGIGDTWGDIAERYEQSKNDVYKLKAFYNNDLGLAWDDTEDTIEWKSLYARRMTYGQYLPPDIRLITMGVDVQKRYLAYEIVGWTRDKKSYSLEYEEMTGDTSEGKVWQELRKVMDRRFQMENSRAYFPIARIGIDTGYRASTVYEFVRDQDPTRVSAVDGRAEEAAFIVGNASHVDVDFDGKRTAYGLKLYPVGTHVIKSELYSWLKLKPLDDGSYPPGYCHFPDQHGPEYFQQLTAEELRSANTKKGESYTWVKIRKRNEALDCRVYARAMAYLWGLDTQPKEYWDDLDEKIIKARK